MRLFGLIGYPLGHSFSASFFSERFAAAGMDCRYRNFPIEAISLLPSIIDENPDLEGFNVTIPYKQQILPFIDRLDPAAEAIGAVNCVRVVRGEGRPVLYGYNTDCDGFERSLLSMIGAQRPRALILGAGGAARAVAYVLSRLGMEFLFVSRIMGPDVLAYEQVTPEILAECRLLINATPLGTYPNVEPAPGIDYALLTPRHYLHDLVYNPSLTTFLDRGRVRGAMVKNGYHMLVGQALRSWEVWSGSAL